MDTALPDQTLKRKRSPEAHPGPGTASMTPANVTQINYLVKARSERLRLIEGDAETFGDVLGMIDDYEGKSRDLVFRWGGFS
jgi:hypothetical protein